MSFIIYGSLRFGKFPIPSNTFSKFACLLQDKDSVQRNLEALGGCHSQGEKKSILLSIQNVQDHMVFSTVLPNEVLTFHLQHRSSATTKYYSKQQRNLRQERHQLQVRIDVWSDRHLSWYIFFPWSYIRVAWRAFDKFQRRSTQFPLLYILRSTFKSGLGKKDGVNSSR